jgi:hypothetical protein
VDAAARAGRLSPDQAALVSDAVAADPSAEASLLGHAEQESLRELADVCGKVKAAATDPEERHARVHRERRLRTWTDPDGGWNLQMRNTAEVGAAIVEAIRPIQERIFTTARREGRHESPEAYAADALAEAVLSEGESAGSPVHVASRNAKIIVRVDWDAFVRGYPIEGEVCEIAGIGPVPMSVVQAMLETGDPFLTAVVTRGADVVNVAHLGRKATDFQLTGLQWRDPMCDVLGCSHTWRLEKDHHLTWASTKITLLALLNHYCEHHHDLKTTQGWDLVEGSGRRPMVPPDDPRHPRFSQMARAG